MLVFKKEMGVPARSQMKGEEGFLLKEAGGRKRSLIAGGEVKITVIRECKGKAFS